MVDDPSIEDKGGFEFASGMDIFSEPGVLKAALAMAEVTYGTGATPTDVPRWMVDTATGGGTRAYIAAGSKILESTDGLTWNLFLTNSNGAILGLAIWAGYVVYASEDKIGRTLIGDASLADDSFITGLDPDTEYHPMVPQGGTLKIGAGRYVASIDEAWAFTPRAMKLQIGSRIRTLEEHLTNLYAGRRMGAATGAVSVADSSVFGWRGTVLSSGSALPDVPYPMKMRGMNALLSDGQRLYAFPDRKGDILGFTGSGFDPFRNIFAASLAGSFIPNPGSVCQHLDSILISGESGGAYPGVYQMKQGALCHAFIPPTFTPGGTGNINVGFVKSSFNGVVFIGYYDNTSGTYHVARSNSSAFQDGSVIRTLWHRAKTDYVKRWGGVKLNLKTLPTGCSVDVASRTRREDSFVPFATLTSANQNRPARLAVHPRTRDIQYEFAFSVNGLNAPELMSYDPLFEILKSPR